MNKEVEPRLLCVGLSRDHRTNQWEIVCLCGTRKRVPTTMYSNSSTQCNKCGKQWFLDYNKETITELYKQDDKNNTGGLF